MYKYWTGVGSRETPQHILEMMTKISKAMSSLEGRHLRSGGANGADSAFALGCPDDKKTIYIPWDGYNGLKLEHPIVEEATNIASRLHPAWNNLSNGAKLLMSRNVYQVLGHELNKPSDFLVCYTKDSCINHAQRTSKTGGTGLAISLASEYGIPVFNLARHDHYSKFLRYTN